MNDLGLVDDGRWVWVVSGAPLVGGLSSGPPGGYATVIQTHLHHLVPEP